jgi:synaptobrevin
VECYRSSKTGDVMRDVDEVKGIMADNVDKILENHEAVESLEGKTGKFFYEFTGSK